MNCPWGCDKVAEYVFCSHDMGERETNLSWGIMSRLHNRRILKTLSHEKKSDCFFFLFSQILTAILMIFNFILGGSFNLFQNLQSVVNSRVRVDHQISSFFFMRYIPSVMYGLFLNKNDLHS